MATFETHYRNIMLNWEELPNKQFPMIFHAVYGKDEREENSPSFFNVTEVETVEFYLKKLLDDKERSKRLMHLKPEMVGIISPYKKQVGKLWYKGRILFMTTAFLEREETVWYSPYPSCGSKDRVVIATDGRRST